MVTCRGLIRNKISNRRSYQSPRDIKSYGGAFHPNHIIKMSNSMLARLCNFKIKNYMVRVEYFENIYGAQTGVKCPCISGPSVSLNLDLDKNLKSENHNFISRQKTLRKSTFSSGNFDLKSKTCSK